MVQASFDPDAITKKISDVKDTVVKGATGAVDKAKVVGAIAGLGDAIGSKPPSEANKAGSVAHGVDVVKGVQKKASDVLKTADAIVNSPEVAIVGGLAGPEVDGAIKKIQPIIKDALNNPLIVGSNKA